MMRQHVDVDVSARHQDVWATDERGCNEAVRDEVGLPDGVLIEHVAHEHHVADDHHASGNETSSHVAAQVREQPYRAGKAIEGCALAQWRLRTSSRKPRYAVLLHAQRFV